MLSTNRNFTAIVARSVGADNTDAIVVAGC